MEHNEKNYEKKPGAAKSNKNNQNKPRKPGKREPELVITENYYLNRENVFLAMIISLQAQLLEAEKLNLIVPGLN